MNNQIRIFFGFLLLSLGLGCSSVNQRIKDNPLVYNDLPQDMQRDLKKGKIQPGWSGEMVEVALGKPNRKYFRKTDRGQILVWAYTGSLTRPEKQKVSGTFKFRDKDRRFQTATDTVIVTVNRYIEYDRLRVEFVNNKVSAIEEVTAKPAFF